MDKACKEFLKALREAETSGTTLTLVDIGKRISRFPPGTTALDVLEKCRERGWVMGSAWGPSLTAEGKKQAAQVQLSR